jgi:hypothetical protein
MTNLQPVVISMVIYLILSQLLPKLIKEPTGIEVVDDVVILIISQRNNLTAGAALVGLVTVLTQYVLTEMLETEL